MATKRTTILDVFETRMKSIDGTPDFVFDLNNNVERIGEIPSATKQDFTGFPKLYYLVEDIGTRYTLGGYFLENMRVDAYAVFDGKLAGSAMDDFISDIYLALGTNANDVKMNNNADFFILDRVEKVGWLAEENLTFIHFLFRCQYRRLATER